MVKCSFCGHQIEQGTGKLLVKINGNLMYYCSNKCEKNNNKLKRVPRDIKWTEEHRKNTVVTNKK